MNVAPGTNQSFVDVIFGKTCTSLDIRQRIKNSFLSFAMRRAASISPLGVALSFKAWNRKYVSFVVKIRSALFGFYLSEFYSFYYICRLSLLVAHKKSNTPNSCAQVLWKKSMAMIFFNVLNIYWETNYIQYLHYWHYKLLITDQ